MHATHAGASARPIGIAARTPRWRLCLASALLALGLQPATPAQAKCTAEMLELPVRMEGSRAIATVGINGTQVPLIVDSGAFFSMLTEGTAAQLKLPLHFLNMRIEGITGSYDHAHMTSVEHLQLLGGDLQDMEFVVAGNELDHLAMGLLGRNILAVMDVEYDLAHGAIRLVRPSDDCADVNMAYWAGTTPVSEINLVRESRNKIPSIRAILELNGRKTEALFDTGATTLVSLGAAHAAGVKDADMTPDGNITGAGQGRAKSWTANFDRVELGGEAVLHNRLQVGDFNLRDADMLIGIDFFLSHRIYISKRRSHMFFTYNGGPVFALNKGDKAVPPEPAASAPDTLTADEHARRGAASLARGDVVAALADLDRACAMEPDNADFHVARASAFLRSPNGGGKALADLDAALRLAPARLDARLERARGRQADGQKDLALDDLALLDKTASPQSQVHAEMALLYGRMQMPALAIAQWNLWIAAHSHDNALENAFNARCWARTQLGVDLDKAVDDCGEAIDADSRNASYRDSRGWAYLRQGKLSQSLADFDRSLKLRSGAAWSLYGRGLVRLGLGDAAAAKADLAAARAADARIDDEVRHAGMPLAPDAPALAARP